MAEKRKLQSAIDMTLKKVNEGVDAFEDIWQKIQSASNSNQKDKYETELKKEIKKLQRLREQIKAWQSSNEIKDKKLLIEARKNIESVFLKQMEKFKAIERETKQKPYSKDALGVGGKHDPQIKEQEEIKEWLNECVASLNTQIEDYEQKLEDLNSNRKKKNEKEKIESLKLRIETHRRHVDTLERIVEMLNDNQIGYKKIQDVKEDVDDYIEHNSDADFEENQYLFDDLELDKIAANSASSLDNETDLTLSDSSSTHSIHSPCPSPTNLSNNSTASSSTTTTTTNASTSNDTSNRRRHKSESNLNNNQTLSAASTSTTATSSSSSAVSTTTATENDLATTSTKQQHHDKPPPPAHTSNQRNRTNSAATSNKNKTNTIYNNNSFLTSSNSIVASQITSTPTSSTTTQPVASIVSTVTASSSSTVASTTVVSSSTPISFSAALTSNSSSPSSLTTTTLTTSSSSTTVNQSKSINTSTPPPPSPQSNTPTNNPIFNKQISINQQENPPPIDLPPLQISPQTSLTQLNRQTSTKTPEQHPQIVNNNPPMNSLKSMAEIAVGNSQNTQIQPQQSLAAPSLNNPATLVQMISQQQQLAASLDTSNRLGIQIPSTSTIGGYSPSSTSTTSLLTNQQQLINSNNNNNNSNTTNQETFIQPILGVAPLGKITLTKEQNQQLLILDSAVKKLPQPSDSERFRTYLPRSNVHTPSYYPLQPPQGHDTLEFLCKLSYETLFFMFYYMEGTKAQFLAAQALKKLSWRFHMRYMMWFQRLEEPKVITDEFEQGTYIYFDYEKWTQRKKEGFTFEYKYLEDRDLSNY